MQDHEFPLSQTRSNKSKDVSPKEIVWKNKLAEVGRWKDIQGTLIENGIKETVAVLNLLGLPTIYSCEGHADVPGILTPWVRIMSNSKGKEKLQENQQLLKRLKNLVEEFYLKKTPDRKAFMRIALVKDIILMDAGDDEQYEADRAKFVVGPDEPTIDNITPEQMSERKKVLILRQEEMTVFTEFMKKKFFAD